MADQAVWVAQLIDRFTTPARKIASATLKMTRRITKAGEAMKTLGYHFTTLRGIISASYGAMLIAFPIKKAA